MRSRAAHRLIYRFGLFEFDPESGELRKNGLRVRLSQQSSKLLNVLITSNGRLCTRAELRQQLWPADTFVDFEHSLNKAIWGLRQALGDFVVSPRYIETVAGQGYRFLVSPQNGHSDSQAGRARTLESLAVIPLANPAGSEEGGFFTSQVASRLTNKLCGLAKLRVLAHSTVKQYELVGLDPRAAGSRLGVDAVLTGEIVQRNGDVIITLELIDTTDGTHIWGTQLKEVWPQAAERTEQIADDVVQQLRPTLARIRKGSAASGSPELKPSKGRMGILGSALFRPGIRPKKAFLIA